MLGIAIEQETKTFTVREVWEALKQNGLQHLRSTWYIDGTEDGTAKGACAIGQAAYNLGVPYTDEMPDESTYDNLSEALNQFTTPRKWAHYGETTAEAIVAVNDAYRINKETGMIARHRLATDGAEASGKPYYRFSYNEVVKIAHEILEPYFDKTITLPIYEY